MNDYDVLIAGSGVAGLYAALNFAPDVRVLVLSKRELTLCNSFLAQGGVAAVVDKENDDYRLHIADTLIAGGYKNDLRSLEILVNEGPEDVLRLIKEMGVDFDRDSAASHRHDAGGRAFPPPHPSSQGFHRPGNHREAAGHWPRAKPNIIVSGDTPSWPP